MGSILINFAISLGQPLPLDAHQTGHLTEVGRGVLEGDALPDLGCEEDVASHLLLPGHLLELLLLAKNELTP